jgi:hypothetical protein
MGRSIVEMQLERGGAVSKKYLAGLKEGGAKGVQDEIYSYFRKTGMPVHSYSEHVKRKIFSSLCALRVETVISGDIIRGHACASGLASSYFPHMNEVRCRHFKTVEELFADEDSLRRVLGVRLLALSGAVSSARLRSIAGLTLGAARPSNFRPAVAKAIYSLYAKDGVVWDMSCGWGGRLLGAMACPVAKYIGTDPSTKTFKGLQTLAKDMSQWSETVVELHCLGSEDFTPKAPVDLCFTSPPYFDVEKYSDESSQSYVKFPTIDLWLNGFLFQTVTNCRDCLRRDGTLVLNVWPKLAEGTIRVCKRAGFRLDSTLQLALAKMPGNHRKRSVSGLWKFEPVLIFKKR